MHRLIALLLCVTAASVCAQTLQPRSRHNPRNARRRDVAAANRFLGALTPGTARSGGIMLDSAEPCVSTSFRPRHFRAGASASGDSLRRSANWRMTSEVRAERSRYFTYTQIMAWRHTEGARTAARFERTRQVFRFSVALRRKRARGAGVSRVIHLVHYTCWRRPVAVRLLRAHNPAEVREGPEKGSGAGRAGGCGPRIDAGAGSRAGTRRRFPRLRRTRSSPPSARHQAVSPEGIRLQP